MGRLQQADLQLGALGAALPRTLHSPHRHHHRQDPLPGRQTRPLLVPALRLPAVQTMALPAKEFLRRYLQHVVLMGFQKLRYFVLLSPANRGTLRRL